MKILISDKINEKGVEILKNEGLEVVEKFSLSQEELLEEIREYDGIIVRCPDARLIPLYFGSFNF